ncbi:MAG: hypothetical protein AAB477_01665 [Patescibacteria group bacterium]
MTKEAIQESREEKVVSQEQLVEYVQLKNGGLSEETDMFKRLLIEAKAEATKNPDSILHALKMQETDRSLYPAQRALRESKEALETLHVIVPEYISYRDGLKKDDPRIGSKEIIGWTSKVTDLGPTIQKKLSEKANGFLEAYNIEVIKELRALHEQLLDLVDAIKKVSEVKHYKSVTALVSLIEGYPKLIKDKISEVWREVGNKTPEEEEEIRNKKIEIIKQTEEKYNLN